MILKGQLTKISAGNSQERHIFLLDNLLVYCKKIGTYTLVQSVNVCMYVCTYVLRNSWSNLKSFYNYNRMYITLRMYDCLKFYVSYLPYGFSWITLHVKCHYVCKTHLRLPQDISMCIVAGWYTRCWLGQEIL